MRVFHPDSGSVVVDVNGTLYSFMSVVSEQSLSEEINQEMCGKRNWQRFGLVLQQKPWALQKSNC